MKPDRDISKLPQWAQNEIKRLTANLESAYERLAAGPDDSDTFADPYHEESTRPLGKGTIILFGTERGKRFRVRYENGRLDVNADEGLAIEPRAANSIFLTSNPFGKAV